MTKYDEVGRIGPVTITQVEAEISDNPTTFMLDCDNAVKCEWGMVGVSGREEANRHAQDHHNFHVRHGADSTEWRKSFTG